MKNDPAKKIAQLVKELNRHNYLYYVKAAPEISDRDYDRKLKELEELEEQYPELIQPDSPTRRVGSDAVEGFEKVTHPVGMLSIQNAYSQEELFAFDARVRKETERDTVDYVVEPKIDGVSLTVMYSGGVLEYGATRGNGRVGDVITENVRTILAIPLKLAGQNVPPRIEVRGEVYFREMDFEALNKKREENGEEKFANPRNAAAGTLKLLESKQVAKRRLSFYAYTVGASENFPVKTQHEILEKLTDFGFAVNPLSVLCRGIDEVWKAITDFDAKRAGLDYAVDGAVVKVNELALQRDLGSTSKAPKWVFAYKYESEQADTRVNAVTVQVGRLGTCTPVAELDPVELAGTTVKRATLHNAGEIKRLGLHVGDEVVIEKAGEIIPKVIRVVPEKRKKGAEPFEFPEKCPECETPLVKEDVYLRCPNVAGCPAQVKGRIVGYASRGGMDIEGLGPAVVKQLYDRGLVREFTDIYQLDYDHVIGLEKMADKATRNLLGAIEESKKRPLSRLIYSLGIPNIGAHLGEVLADAFGDLEKLAEASKEELEKIEEVGPTVAESIEGFFKSDRGKQIVSDLKKAGVNTRQKKTRKASDTFAGQTFVLTGSLEHYTRSEAARLIKQHGGKCSSSVSPKTDYVLVGENPGSKADKAEKLGVAKITEGEFEKMLAGEPPKKSGQTELFE